MSAEYRDPTRKKKYQSPSRKKKSLFNSIHLQTNAIQHSMARIDFFCFRFFFSASTLRHWFYSYSNAVSLMWIHLLRANRLQSIVVDDCGYDFAKTYRTQRVKSILVLGFANSKQLLLFSNANFTHTQTMNGKSVCVYLLCYVIFGIGKCSFQNLRENRIVVIYIYKCMYTVYIDINAWIVPTTVSNPNEKHFRREKKRKKNYAEKSTIYVYGISYTVYV